MLQLYSLGSTSYRKTASGCRQGYTQWQERVRSLPTVFGKSLVYQLLPVCAKRLSLLFSTDYNPFVVILSHVCVFVVKKIIIFIVLAVYTGMWQIVLDPLSCFRKPHPLSGLRVRV